LSAVTYSLLKDTPQCINCRLLSMLYWWAGQCNEFGHEIKLSSQKACNVTR